MSLNDAEGPNEPLALADTNYLIQFLREHPGIKLHVVDTTKALSNVRPEDGRLTIGINDTLVARFGVNGFAVINYPGRFKLDTPSLETYRRIVRKEALAAARVEPDDELMIGRARYGRYEPEPDRAEALRDLTAKLTRAFSRHQLVYTPDERAFGFSRNSDIVAEYEDAATEAGLATMDFKLGSYEVPGVWGQAVADLLEKTLQAGGEREKIDRLKQTDSCSVGLWVIIFDRGDRKIIIGNQRFAEEHLARFLT